MRASPVAVLKTLTCAAETAEPEGSRTTRNGPGRRLGGGESHACEKRDHLVRSPHGRSLHLRPDECLPHTDADFAAQAAEIVQAHRNSGPWANAAGHSDIDLVQTGKSGSITKKENLSQPAANGRKELKSATTAGALVVDLMLSLWCVT